MSKRHQGLAPDGDFGARLQALRNRVGMTQVDLARRLQVSQTALSHMENRGDLLLSTLTAYLEALGGSLEINVNFADDEPIRLIGADRDDASAGEVVRPEQIEVPLDSRQLGLPGIPDITPPRDVVLSVRPKHADNILVGAKTVELRRRFTEDIGKGSRAFIYSTSPISALTGFARIGAIRRMPVQKIWRDHHSEAQVRKQEFETYFSGCDEGYAIFLNAPQLFPRPFSLPELRLRFGFEPPQSFLYAPPGFLQLFEHERPQVPH